MRLIQVTLLAGATPITSGKVYSPFLVIQNNAAANIRVGDNTVSSTKGILLAPSAAGAPGGSITVQRADDRVFLGAYYLFGTAGQIVDVLYE